MMRTIQVDMFDVQLGAAMLLQFRNDGDADNNETVRVLADAGVDPHSGYAQNHVLAPLKQAMQGFGDGALRVDLIIGTHYDADHLEGLIPIVNDQSISFGEAWMPPVADDTPSNESDDEPQQSNMLASRLASEDGAAVLQRYLQSKRDDCERLHALQQIAERFKEDEDSFRPRRVHDSEPEFQRQRREMEIPGNWVDENYFRYQIEETAEAIAEMPLGASHADNDIQDPSDFDWQEFGARYEDELIWPHWLLQPVPWPAEAAEMSYYWSQHPGRAGVDARSLALIRRSTAQGAITASSLYKVVKALRARKIPIFCQLIDAGQPRKFRWQRNSRQFKDDPNLVHEPELVLLGPSRGLVQKHWRRLPIGSYARMMFLLRLPSKSITPSNQLSYVARIGFADQGILVTGDAGCVDFAPGRGKPFYQALLNALLPLHVIQVAHHGGNNAQFYNVLLSAQYPAQAAASKLLLSHATNDQYRPSTLFDQFLAAVAAGSNNAQILFTARPRPARFNRYSAVKAPAVGMPQQAGDVRLNFDGSQWNVTKHAV